MAMMKTKANPKTKAAPARATRQRATRDGAGKGMRAAESKLADLRTRLREISDLAAANAVLSWDQSTYMPTGGADARGRQCGLISRRVHERKTDPALGRLIDQLTPFAESLPADSDDARLIAV